MICKFCGNEIDDGSDFCFICGQKVEANQEAPVQNANDVYSQPQTPVAEAIQPQVDVEVPVYQQPVAPQPDVAPEAPAKKKKRKEKKAKKPSAASKGIRFVCFLFAIIGLILYKKAKKAGNDEKATAILNAIMSGVCVKLAVVNVVLAKKFLFGAV